MPPAPALLPPQSPAQLQREFCELPQSSPVSLKETRPELAAWGAAAEPMMEAARSIRDGQVRSIVQAMLQDERREIEKMFQLERQARREASRADFARFEDLFKAELESGSIRLGGESAPVPAPAPLPAERSREADPERRQLSDKVDMLHAFVAGMRSDGEVVNDTVQQTEVRITNLEKQVDDIAVDVPALRQSLESLRKDLELLRVPERAEALPAEFTFGGAVLQARGVAGQANPCEAASPDVSDVGGGDVGGFHRHVADLRRRLGEDRKEPDGLGGEPPDEAGTRSRPTSRQAMRPQSSR